MTYPAIGATRNNSGPKTMYGEDREDYKLVTGELVLLMASFASLLSALGLITTL
ncbi:MAG: hypothetical protein O7G86_20565 [Gammaproteobacteria bacterium]|nr:hypothetical protein [Gammaproteobacteria bacterium]MCZ6856316.1 hypothetical protein [Gammaproteobacteria bacterium]